MTDTSTVTTVATPAVVTKVETAATTEVASLSSHWHVPVWAVIVILAIAAVVVVHFVL